MSLFLKNEYQDALKNSSYKTKVNFEKNNKQKKKEQEIIEIGMFSGRGGSYLLIVE